METSIALRKLQAIELITKLENEDLLTLIEQLLTGEEASDNADWADSLSEQEKASINKGLKELDEGKRISYDDFKKEMKKRFP